MPHIAINYESTKVSFYRFVCNDPEIKSSYVGSTVNFRERKANHKKCCNNPNDKVYHLKIYQTIRDNGDWDNWRMIEIESRLVKDKREAERIETEFMEKFQSDMNSKKAHRIFETKAEYHKDWSLENADKLKEQKQQYYLDNKERWEKAAEKRKEKITCECGCVVSKGRFTTHLKSPKHAKLMETKIASADI